MYVYIQTNIWCGEALLRIYHLIVHASYIIYVCKREIKSKIFNKTGRGNGRQNINIFFIRTPRQNVISYNEPFFDTLLFGGV